MRVGRANAGFTLLEIMVSVSLLALSFLVVLDTYSVALLKSGRAEDVTVATMLARLKLSEIQLEFEKEMAGGTFPKENKTMEGKFEEPYEKYSWTAAIDKVEIPIPPQPEQGTEAGAASMDMMMRAFGIVAEKIGESAREIKLEIKWNDGGEDQTLTVATHIVKL